MLKIDQRKAEFKKNKNGTKRSLHAPSIFEGVPQSSIPTSQLGRNVNLTSGRDWKINFPSFKDVDKVDYVTLVSSIGQ